MDGETLGRIPGVISTANAKYQNRSRTSFTSRGISSASPLNVRSRDSSCAGPRAGETIGHSLLWESRTGLTSAMRMM